MPDTATHYLAASILCRFQAVPSTRWKTLYMAMDTITALERYLVPGEDHLAASTRAVYKAFAACTDRGI